MKLGLFNKNGFSFKHHEKKNSEKYSVEHFVTISSSFQDKEGNTVSNPFPFPHKPRVKEKTEKRTPRRQEGNANNFHSQPPLQFVGERGDCWYPKSKGSNNQMNQLALEAKRGKMRVIKLHLDLIGSWGPFLEKPFAKLPSASFGKLIFQHVFKLIKSRIAVKFDDLKPLPS